MVLRRVTRAFGLVITTSGSTSREGTPELIACHFGRARENCRYTSMTSEPHDLHDAHAVARRLDIYHPYSLTRSERKILTIEMKIAPNPAARVSRKDPPNNRIQVMRESVKEKNNLADFP